MGMFSRPESHIIRYGIRYGSLFKYFIHFPTTLDFIGGGDEKENIPGTGFEPAN
jgi:hypothetical protein